MASDVMRVRLHLRQVRVLEVLAGTPDVLRVSVESTSRRLRCAHCGFKCHRVHDTREKQVRDLEVSGRRPTLVWMRRRFRCDNCDSRFLEEHPEFDGGLTRRLAQRLVADAQVMTIRAATRRHGVSWPVINALVRAWSGLVAEHRRSRRCRVLLVDETSMRKRHRYVTVIVNGDTGRTLAMVEHRSSAADASPNPGPPALSACPSPQRCAPRPHGTPSHSFVSSLAWLFLSSKSMPPRSRGNLTARPETATYPHRGRAHRLCAHAPVGARRAGPLRAYSEPHAASGRHQATSGRSVLSGARRLRRTDHRVGVPGCARPLPAGDTRLPRRLHRPHHRPRHLRTGPHLPQPGGSRALDVCIRSGHVVVYCVREDPRRGDPR